MSLSDRIKLIVTKVEILRMIANDYVWQCETNKEAKGEILLMLAEVNRLLAEDKNG